jgi:IS1 family transposase
MNRLSTKQRTQVIAGLVEGMAINAIVRTTGVSKPTILKLICDLGEACMKFEDETLVNLPCKKIQCDEIWSFCYAKEKNVPQEKQNEFGYGDVWTWTALDADTKLLCSWTVGDRTAITAKHFMKDLASRLKNRVQLTTDGHRPYVEAVEEAFGSNVDYATLVKQYDNDARDETRYSPAECIGCRSIKISGKPAAAYISTSYVERHNLSIRMHMRRYTRLTNVHSKKIQNHICAFAIHSVYYNFAKIHQTLRVTPAMEAGVSDHVWSLEKIAGLLG